MSTILIYTSPARGHLYPMMDVALELRDAGHRVVVQTLAAERDVVAGEGLEHRPIAPAIEALPLEDYVAGNPMAQLVATAERWLERAEHEIGDLETAERELAPDLLVVDANSWGAAAFAEARGRPWAAFLPYALPTPDPDVPAFGPGFAPPRHGFDRLRDGAVRALTNMSLRGVMKRLDTLRAELGVSPVRTMGAICTRADALLYRSAEPLEYARRSWPANVHPLGPGLWAPAGDAPAWLGDLPRPRTLVNVSTEFQDDGAIVETALAALAGEPGSVIVTTAALDPAAFQAPHERVRVTRFLPHAAVIPEVDVVVGHGGMGTTQRALAAGVPVVVIPWGRDQNETARRAEVAGAGVRLPRGKLSPERLRAAVRSARHARAGAERVAAGFRAAGGAPRAVAILEGLMAGATAPTAVPGAGERAEAQFRPARS